jgi:hypothetical protein
MHLHLLTLDPHDAEPTIWAYDSETSALHAGAQAILEDVDFTLSLDEGDPDAEEVVRHLAAGRYFSAFSKYSTYFRMRISIEVSMSIELENIQETVAPELPICKHCNRFKREHDEATEKCLFDSGRYSPCHAT